MYELLLKIDSKLGQRYKTIETNIKAKSNSFYESLLALLEGLARLIARKENIAIDSEYDTLIGILRVKDFKKYCLQIGVSDEEYEKLFSIAKTVNSHKHDSETKVTLEIVIEYLQATFNFVKAYYIAKFKTCDTKFSSKEISDLYGMTEKEIKKLEEEKAKLEESLLKSSNASEMLISDLERVREIQKAKEKEYASFDEQKEALMSQISELKDIKLSSMEEKVSQILVALRNQTAALNDVTNLLGYAAKVNFGRPIEHAVTFSRGGERSVPTIKLTEYERYLYKKEYDEAVKKAVWERIVAHAGEEFVFSGRYSTTFFTYTVGNDKVTLSSASEVRDEYGRVTSKRSADKTEVYSKDEFLLNIQNIKMVSHLNNNTDTKFKGNTSYSDDWCYPILVVLCDKRIFWSTGFKLDMTDLELVRFKSIK